MALLDHADQTGAPRDFVLDGRTYPVSGLTPYQLGQLEAYLKDAVPSPLVEFQKQARSFEWTPEERRALFDDARKRAEPQYDHTGFQTGGWPVTFNSREGQSLLFNGPGIARFLWVVLSKLTPTLTMKDAERLAPLMSVEKIVELSELIATKNPSPGSGGPLDDDGPSPNAPIGYVDPNG